MKRTLLVNVAIVLGVLWLNAQEKSKFKTEVGGFVLYQMYYDTYQNIEYRDGELLLFPKRLDSLKTNESGRIGGSAFFSRGRVKFSGSEAFGAKASGVLEGDFFGTTDGVKGNFRLRNAFIKLDWDKSSLIMGQYWHTIISTDVIPPTELIANLTIWPLNRTPQVNFKYNFTKEFSVTAAAHIHSSHRSKGPAEAQRNSGLPDLTAKINYGSKNFVVGGAFGVNTLKPRLTTDSGAETDKTIANPYMSAYTKIVTSPLVVKSMFVYGTNLTQFVMLGGIGKDTTNSADDYDYSAMKTMSYWFDICSNTKKIQPAVFFGFTKNLGATGEYVSLYSRFDDLSFMWRVSPRVDFYSGKMKFGVELSYTSAVYGEEWDSEMNVTKEEDPVNNLRLMGSAKFSF